MYMLQKHLSTNQRNWFKEPILLQGLVEPDHNSMFYQMCMTERCV